MKKELSIITATILIGASAVMMLAQQKSATKAKAPVTTAATTPTKPTVAYEPLAVEKQTLLELQGDARSKGYDVQILQAQVNKAQIAFQQAYDKLTTEAETIRKQHGWPDNVQFDANALKFVEVQPPAPVAPAKK